MKEESIEDFMLYQYNDRLKYLEESLERNKNLKSIYGKAERMIEIEDIERKIRLIKRKMLKVHKVASFIENNPPDDYGWDYPDSQVALEKYLESLKDKVFEKLEKEERKEKLKEAEEYGENIKYIMRDVAYRYDEKRDEIKNKFHKLNDWGLYILEDYLNRELPYVYYRRDISIREGIPISRVPKHPYANSITYIKNDLRH